MNFLKSIHREASERIQEFIEDQKSVGIVLFFATILSLLIANLFGEKFLSFSFFHHTFYSLKVFNIPVFLSIEKIVNDFLMPLFFLYIGLEIKQEIIAGDLSEVKSALLPVVGAVGGMIFPAFIYIGLNYNLTSVRGWGIPTATDIAFAIGILSLLGNKVPTSLKLLLTTLAVVDDLGAILVIAIFYTSTLHFQFLIAVFFVFLFLVSINYLKVKSLFPYLLAGVFLLIFLFLSGIHSTIAGVLLAITIPYNRNVEQNPLDKLNHIIHLPVNFFILPIFAFVNTYFLISFDTIDFSAPVGLGIWMGLLIGKPIGITLSILFFQKIGLVQIPQEIKIIQLIGMGLLGGIGFTMSIFVANLAFANDLTLINNAKVFILFASLLAGILGYSLLVIGNKKA